MLPIQRSTGILVRYLTWTNHKPIRIKLINTLSGKSITLSYDHHFDNDYEQAYDYLVKGGCTVSAYIQELRTNDTTLILDRIDNQEALSNLKLV